MAQLAGAVSEALSRSFVDVDIETGVENGRLQAFLAAHGEVLSKSYHDSRVVIHCRIAENHLGRIREEATEIRPRLTPSSTNGHTRRSVRQRSSPRLISRGPSHNQRSRSLVTGASGGIGRAIALELARRGSPVVLVARRAELLEQVAAAIGAAGGRAECVVGDVTDPALRRAALERAQSVSAASTCWSTMPASAPSADSTRPARSGCGGFSR